MLVRPFGRITAHAANAALLFLLVAGTAGAYAALPPLIPALNHGRVCLIPKSDAGFWVSPLAVGIVMAVLYQTAAVAARSPETLVKGSTPQTQHWWSFLTIEQKKMVAAIQAEQLRWVAFIISLMLGVSQLSPFMTAYDVLNPLPLVVVAVCGIGLAFRVGIAMFNATQENFPAKKSVP